MLFPGRVRSSCIAGIINVTKLTSLSLVKRGKTTSIVFPGLVSDTIKIIPPDIQTTDYWRTGKPAPSPKRPIMKDASEIAKIKASCQIASTILNSLENFIKVGITTDEIDEHVHQKIIENKCYPSPLNYHGFPKSLCTSVNNVACHGIPDDRALCDGDIINVDITVYKDGYHGDCSRMFLVGNVDPQGTKLCEVTYQALMKAIAICRDGELFCKIGETIEDYANSEGFIVLPAFVGHGIGSYFHEKPDILHYRNGEPGQMQKGMVFTIEPILSEGTLDEVNILEDGWTAVTEDNARTAQWEHTIVIEEEGATILTQPREGKKICR